MKKKIASLLLALVMVLSLVPAQALAADSGIALHPGLVFGSPEVPTTNGRDLNNKVNIHYTDGGTVTATQRDEDDWDSYAVITAIPDEGYVLYGLEVENANGEESNIRYLGNHVFEVEMIYDTTTDIYIYFTKPQGEKHEIRVEVYGTEGGTYTVTKTEAYAGEQIFVDLDLAEHYSRAYVNFSGGIHHRIFDAKHSEERYEFLMPEGDVIISISYLKDTPVSMSCYSYGGGTISLDIKDGYPGDVFHCTIKPLDGYRINYIACADRLGTLPLKYVGGDCWEGVIREGASHIGIDVTFIQSENPFLDVAANAFYYDSVIWALENGITTGTDMSHFNPNGECMRAQIVTFLWRAAGCPVVEAENPFTDVRETDFYYDAVLWAVENGITTGTSATTFSPFKTCSRAEVVTFLWRAHGKPGSSAANPFVDVADTDFFHTAVLWAVENGITNGMDATHFGSLTVCNRAQVVTFLYRAKDVAVSNPDVRYTFELKTNDPTEEIGWAFCEGTEFAAGESVVFYAEPWFGYLVDFEAEGELELYYLGACSYELIMPDHDVTLTVNFVPAQGDAHFINTTCENGEFYTVCDVDDDFRDIAKPGEYVQFYVMADEGFTLDPENITMTADGESWDAWWFLGQVSEPDPELEMGSIFVFEAVMPDADLNVSITCTAEADITADPVRIPVSVN